MNSPELDCARTQALAVAQIALALPENLNNASLLVALNRAYRAGFDDAVGIAAMCLTDEIEAELELQS